MIYALAVSAFLVLSAFSVEHKHTDVKREAVAQPVASSSSWTVDQSHSQIGFKVRHLGIANVRGFFREYEVDMDFDPEDLSSLQVTATISVSSIDTGNERRDNHLRSDDFFNSEQYPSMSFTSTRVRNVEGNNFELVGNLTVRDVTKEVVLEAEFLGAGAMGENMKVGFEAMTTISRFDYNMKWDRVMEAGGLVVAEDVDIILELEMDQATSS